MRVRVSPAVASAEAGRDERAAQGRAGVSRPLSGSVPASVRPPRRARRMPQARNPGRAAL
jgi:hypothetical protein